MKAQPAKKRMAPQVLQKRPKTSAPLKGNPGNTLPRKPYSPGSIKRGYTKYA
jgi:hypothetical protein